MASLIGSIPKLITEFTNIALSDPLSALLMAFGSLFIAVSVAVLGYLALGATLDAVTPDFSSQGPPRQAR